MIGSLKKSVDSITSQKWTLCFQSKSLYRVVLQKWTEEKTKADGEIKKLQNELKTKEANLAKLERWRMLDYLVEFFGWIEPEMF